MRGRVLVGVSGWSYRSWHGDWYPSGVRVRDELPYLTGRLRTAELNASFYSLRDPATYEHWYDQTPEGFVLAVKGSRFVTHVKRLRDVRAPLANFFASGVLALRDRLGPFLWQLPARFDLTDPALPVFLRDLPKDTDAVRRLARRHDARVSGRVWIRQAPCQAVRHALEIQPTPGEHRDGVDALADAAVREGVALVVSDSPAWEVLDRTTAGFAYARLHGAQRLYGGGYDDRALDGWAAWAGDHAAAGRDVYVYFDNDADGRAPYDAERLAALCDRL